MGDNWNSYHGDHQQRATIETVTSSVTERKDSISRGETHSDMSEWPHRAAAQHNSISEQINYQLQLLRSDWKPQCTPRRRCRNKASTFKNRFYLFSLPKKRADWSWGWLGGDVPEGKGFSFPTAACGKSCPPTSPFLYLLNIHCTGKRQNKNSPCVFFEICSDVMRK